MSYKAESQALDTEILGIIERWHRHGETLDDVGFNDLALRLFAYQLRYNGPYARYCERLGVRLSSMPPSWESIPAVPSDAFKEASVATFEPAAAALTFETSGTTHAAAGRHYMETPALYDAALLAAFDRFVLHDRTRLRYFNLLPNPAECGSSSLGYMMARVANVRGEGRTGWYLRGDELLFEAFAADVNAAIEEAQPICLGATAFALVHLLDAMDRHGTRVALPCGSRVMETGGFKGRSRSVDRDELYAATCARFGIAADAIIGEYGMTELTSQYYDKIPTRRKAGPPWLRARVVGPARKTLPLGTVGSLLHVDLANRSSCIAVQTEDVGVQYDEGFVVLGREQDASPRGCSLGAEDLELKTTM